MSARASQGMMLAAGILAAAMGPLAVAPRAQGWHGGEYRQPLAIVPSWTPAPFVAFLAAVPVPGTRLFHPPGLPLSYQEPATGTTYCYSPGTGFYFVCGYARPAPTGWERPPPPARPEPPAGEETAPPAASGVLLFQLPADAEASVDGEAVGLISGVGAAAVAPGRHLVRLRSGGQETDQIVAVASRAILTVTPGGISPADP